MLTEFAIYIYYGDGNIQKKMYQKSMIFKVEYTKSRITSFILFVKQKNEIERVFYTFSECSYNYDFNNLKIEYNYIKKKIRNDKLLIVFGGANTTTPEYTKTIQNGTFDSSTHNKLNNILRIMPFYNKLSAAPYDIIYISDNFSYGFSWYLYEGTREIDSILANFLSNFISENEYLHTACFGSSKGAFAAINIGNKIHGVEHTFAFAPQIDLESYLSDKKNLYAHFNSIKNFKKLGSNKNNLIHIFTCKNDTQYKHQVEYSKFNNCNLIDLGDKNLNHNDLIIDNYEKVFDDILKIWY